MSVLCVASDRFDPDPCAAALRAAGLTVEVVDDIAAGLWVVAGGDCQVVVMELTDEGGRWELVEAALQAIREAARTGEIGDGRVFICPVEQSYNIRTGERVIA